MQSTRTKVLICPYCGDTQAASERCRACGGLFEPLSRQASHNAMGPWFVRDEKRPFQPGASYETMVRLVEREQINKYTIIRGPTTKQFWTVARRVPGIAHLLGYCHNCDASVGKDDHGCPVCGVPFGAYLDRNYLGLPEVKPLPWEAPVIEDGRPRVAAPPGPVVDFRRAAEPLGLSSFASDDELRGMAAQPPYVPPAPGPAVGDIPLESMDEPGALASPPAAISAPMMPPGEAAAPAGAHVNGDVPNFRPSLTSARGSSPAHVPAAGEPRPALLDSSAASLATRAMQRRLQQQQSTIRLLMIVVGAVAVMAVIVILAMLSRLGRMQQDAASARPQNGQLSQPQPQPEAPRPAEPAAASPNGEGTAPGANAATAPSTTTPAPAPSSAAATPRTSSAGANVREDHQRAAALLLQAKKEDRSLKERIADCEQALALLRAIKANAAAPDQPPTLDAEIAEADRLLEKLKLQEFFP